MYPAGGPTRHNQGYQVHYVSQTNPGQCRPGPFLNRPGTVHDMQQSILGPPPPPPPPLLQPNFVPGPLMVPICGSSFLPQPQNQPQPLFLTKSVSPRRAPPTDNQGHVMPQDSFQRRGGQGGFGPSVPFSPPSPQSMVSNGYSPQGSTSSVLPPLFRPGPHTPSSKATTTGDQKQLNRSEKEDLYRMFGVVLQQHGPIEVTDSRLLSVFMGLSPWMRQGIKYLGGLKDFFRHGDIFKLDGDIVSLAWQGEENGDKSMQSKLPSATKRKSPIPTKPKSPVPTQPKSPISTKSKSTSPSMNSQALDANDNIQSKNIPKDHNAQSSAESDSEEGDAYWEGEEEDQGWWLLDPLPGEEENWKQLTPLQGRMGGGYYDDFKKLEEKDNRDPEESQKKLVSTSTPSPGSSAEKVKKISPPSTDRDIQKKLVYTSTPSLDSKTEEEKKRTPERNDSPTPWNWEESAIAQEAEAELRQEQESKLVQERLQYLETLGKQTRKDVAGSGESDVEGSTGGRSMGEKSDGSIQGEECNRRSPEMVYRSGSLHQAEDDVIVLEDIEVSGEVEEEEEGVVIGGTDSAEEKSDVFTDALEEGPEDIDGVGGGMRVRDNQQELLSINDIPLGEEEKQETEEGINGMDGNEEEQKAGEEMKGLDGNEEAVKKDMISGMISKLITVAISKVTGSEENDEDESCKVTNSPPESTTEQNQLDSKQDSEVANGIVSISDTEVELSKSVRSIGVETTKVQHAHKSMCTREIKTKSRKVNTPSVSTVNRRVGTGEDPRIEQLTSDLEKETRRRRHLADDVEDLHDKLDRRKKEYASEVKELKRELDRTSKDLADCQRKLSGKGVVHLDELRKTNMELKDSESRLIAAKSKLNRADKENYNLTKELEKTTRQLLDLERSQAKKESRSRSTSIGDLEPEKDPAMEEENKLLKMRSRSAEQKVLELQYQYAMQSLNKALQESQYIFRMYGNNLLSSSHRELLRMKWMDYQMYIKEKTDEVATSYYSSLKALQQDVPLADIPSLKTQHIETFNPYKQSPVKAGELGYISAAATGLAVPPQTLPDPSMNPSFPGDPTANQAMDQGVALASGSTKAPPGLTGATAQAPPGLTNIQVAAGSDMGMPFMQAQTQRGAPGKVPRRVPRKTPKAFLAANFMNSLQHTTKVYGSAAGVAPAPQVGLVTSGRGGGVTGGRQSPAMVHDWLDNMDTDNTEQNQVSAPATNQPQPQAPPGFTGPQVATPMDTTATTQQPEEGMDTQTTTLIDPGMMAPLSGMARPAGIGRGKPLSASGMSSQPPGFPSIESQRGEVEAMDLETRPKATETSIAASRLNDTTNATSGTSSSSTSRSASPLFNSQLAGAMERLSRPPGSKRGSPAGSSHFKPGSQVAGAIERLSRPHAYKRGSPVGAVAESQPEDTSRPRPSSAGDAMLESQTHTNAAAKVRSVSLGGGGGAMTSSTGPATNQEPAQQNQSAENFESAQNFQEGGSQVDSMTNVPPRLRARQLRMPYHRGAEEEQMAGASSEGSGDRWTTKLSKRKRKAMNLVEQQTQLIKEHSHLTRSCDTKPTESSKGKGQPPKQGSLDKLVSYLSKQFKQMTRKELTDAILQVRLDHNGSLSGIAMGTIISEASSYLSRAEKKKNRKESDIVGMCAVCQDDLYGDPDERKLDCGHNFHSKCIKTWVSEEGTCPICRKHTLFPEDFPRLQ